MFQLHLPRNPTKIFWDLSRHRPKLQPGTMMADIMIHHCLQKESLLKPTNQKGKAGTDNYLPWQFF
jgi:hypothetical protein